MSNFIPGTEMKVFLALCWKIGTPVAYKAIKMAERADWLGLTRINVEPRHYVCAATYLLDAQVAAYFKKYPGFAHGDSLKEAAIRTFWECEHQCYQTNERLNPLLFDLGHYGDRLRRVISAWRKEVSVVLGKVPLRTSLDGRFGPGSTFRNVGNEITVAHKLSEGYTATRQARSFLHSWDLTAWSRYAACGLDVVTSEYAGEHQCLTYTHDDPHAIRDFEFVRGNRFTTVPKDSLKDRGICVEPSLNVFYQLALGSEISRRLKKRYGWDKSSCEVFHKNLARLGSLTGAVATIDLSNASDTICHNLVKLLLPRSWLELVEELRSPFTFIEGKWVKLEKFSSMGNGFTFELETLLFFTLARVITFMDDVREDPFTPGLTVSVYGDDIVIPTSVADSMVAALGFFGFTPNKKKTFLKGPFRESCGGDFFAGHDVRPHFLKEVCEEPHQLIALANGVRRFGRRSGDLGNCDTHRDAWFRCLDDIPRQIRICRGPEVLGDLVIQDDESFWQSRNPMQVRNSIRYLRVWRPVSWGVIPFDQFRPGVVLAVALLGGSSGPSRNGSRLTKSELDGVPFRKEGSYVKGYRFGRVAYS